MIFYVPDIYQQVVTDPDSAHMISMRLRYNDEVTVTDLQGNAAKVKILDVNKKTKQINFEILNEYSSPNNNAGILFQAMPDKLYVEKLVEVAALQGIHTLYFFYSERSVQQSIKMDRLQRIILRACELGEHYWAPVIEFVDEQRLAELIQQHQPIVLEQILETENSNQGLKSTVMVGSEGGWSKREIQLFKDMELTFHSMGNVVYPAWLAGFAYFERCK